MPQFHSTTQKKYLTGNEVAAFAAKNAGASFMFGYPITPASEILHTWALFCEESRDFQILQTEDEMAAGFGTIGACLAGIKAFTATSGPGNVLMQDAFSMAEALRIPTVAIIQQRGGFSTSTVIYSQEEVTLTCFGGNGEGLRIIYSSSCLQDLYDYTIRAFNSAWKYRFPAFILADGYQAKMKTEVDLWDPLKKGVDLIPSQPILLDPKRQTPLNMRNCYNLEEEIWEVVESYKKDYQEIAPKVTEFEEIKTENCELLVIAHGIVASAVKSAISNSDEVGLFRPVTLRPFPEKKIRELVEKTPRILIVESALGQLGRMVKEALAGVTYELNEFYKPALGFTPEEIRNKVEELL